MTTMRQRGTIRPVIILLIPAAIVNILIVVRSNVALYGWSKLYEEPNFEDVLMINNRTVHVQTQQKQTRYDHHDPTTARTPAIVSAATAAVGITNSTSRSFQTPPSMSPPPPLPSSSSSSSTDKYTRNINKDKNDNVTNIPVFYNLYVSPNNNKDNSDVSIEMERVKKLVIEQLSHLNPQHHYPVYVNSIGQQLTIPNTTQLGYFPKGQETLTLHSLWIHCQNHKDEPNAKVVYLHSKGALHNHERNDRLRAFVTIGAVSDQCTQSENKTTTTTTTTQSCDVCSIRFAPFPHPHVSGNMWTARCQYIAKLRNPLKFERLMEKVPRVKTSPQPYHVGRRRFAAEHWVHSHPSVKPCDVYKGQFTSGYRGAKAILDLKRDLQLVEAPRFQLDYYRDDEKLDYWTGLDARIEEYSELYSNQTTTPWPDDTWWGWKLNTWVQQRQQQQQVAMTTNQTNAT
jgi:hypothetical protein